jgi:hypothetical protein
MHTIFLRDVIDINIANNAGNDRIRPQKLIKAKQ